MLFFNETFEIEDSLLLQWAEEWGIGGDLRKKYILQKLIYADNILSRSAMAGKALTDSYLWQIAVKEIENIQNFRSHASIMVLEDYLPANRECRWKKREEKLYESFCRDDAGEFLNELVIYYQKRGFGDFAFNPFFRWEQGLETIKYPDLVKFSDLIGCESQKRQICRNTEGFLRGNKANNVLLYGERGTGKSSMVKAIGTRYYAKGLRLVELDASRLEELPALCRYLETIPLHFIIYIDDLSFAENQEDYKRLKAILEGGLAKPCRHILIYATSNRRHLVKETWTERGGNEVNTRENMDELLSLSHRFGLCLAFLSPDQEGFLHLVDSLALRRGLEIDTAQLHEEALQWVRWQHQYSGRTAVQFLNDLEIGQMEKGRYSRE